MKYYKLLLATVVLTAITCSSVFATEKKNEDTPITKWIQAENALLDTLPAQNQKVFFVLRNKQSVIRTIRVVRRDVKNAVNACGKNNKDMKQPMNERFKQWEDAVLPILDEAEKFLEQELKEQEAFHVSDYKHVTALNEKAFKFSESKIEKQPVTTKEACEGLLESMNDTEDNLIDILNDILLPEEVIRKRIEQAKKAEEDAS